MDNKTIRIEALITEREGMIAENQQRQQLGESMAFGYDRFMELQTSIIQLLQD